VEQVAKWIRQADPCGYARAYRAFAEADPLIDGRLTELEVPALFVTGGLDPNSTPAMARALASEAPLGQATVLDGERHMMAYASAPRFNSVAREFLVRTAESSRCTV
jgi:pimeloyl-ACP methyl ester carboxylesterase